MKKWTSLIMLLIAVVVFAACGSKEEGQSSSGNDSDKEKQAEKMTIKHEYGEAAIKKNPKKVVVFDFGVLDTLDELGVEVTGVPQMGIPAYLEKYAGNDYTNVGSLKEPDFEAIHKLNPDVIFISSRQAELYDQFAEIAPTVYMGIDFNNYTESFKDNMNTLGKIFDKEEQVKTELEDIDSQIAAVKEKTESLDKKALVVLANEGKVSAYGPKSRFGIIHDVFGFKAADENIEVSTHGQGISFEYILETNPDILFVIDRNAAIEENAAPAKDSIENDLVKKTTAYKDGKIIYLDADYWYLSGGGLQSMKAMIKSVEQAY
ncbi:siderophore ABC transporter substrate-binding protein [Siminovitchia fortis]|uniref:Siderophore ABC transporter substrate-binding protein n=1 Tax=Siminovitchia fortis TaxID=254758 RepID=A0A443IUD2_9BACI|nr:siderophore ABC transporter substrate-binding protein [Siminovitchia fortis]RWR11682.1 siderophore ABC transporter substrate-binding protein [Siminovitchia fortis]WHY83189.1 siderophore ABC transporter substrate-binding protein [Siminovitchia fortis]